MRKVACGRLPRRLPDSQPDLCSAARSGGSRAACFAMRAAAAAWVAAALLAWPASSGENSAPAPTTCFGSQLDGVPHGDRVASAAVYLLAGGKDGIMAVESTGVVVRNSSPVPHGHNRILTAGHVFAAPFPLKEPGRLLVFASDGAYLGKAEMAARARPEGSVSLTERVAGDAAVLEMAEGADGWRPYDAIEGLDLSPGVSGRPLTAMVGTPGGLGRGASGSGVLDLQGRILAVVSAIRGSGTGGTVSFTTRSIDEITDRRLMAAGHASGMLPTVGDARSISLPLRNRGYFSPIGDSALLAALGPAGVQAAATGDVPEHGSAVRIAGFPHQECTVYSGLAEPFDESKPEHLDAGARGLGGFIGTLAAALSNFATGSVVDMNE